jgi:tetratricopeptide (TPR) repeat protein
MNIKRFICFIIILISPVIISAEVDKNTYHILRANALAHKKNYQEALAHLDQSISLKPSARAYKVRGHVHYAMGNYQKAWNDLNQAVALAPDSATILADRAIVNFQLGKREDAKKDIRRALELKPNSAFALMVQDQIEN